jgi:hypothetical protein
MTIVEILKELRIPYKEAGEHHHVSHGWVGVDCPDCSPGWGHYRLGFHLGTGGAYCWLCGKRPSRLMLSRLAGKPVAEINPLYSQLQLVETRRKSAHEGRSLKFPPFQKWDLQHQEAEPHRWYLAKRKLHIDAVGERWGVTALRLAGRWSWRLLIPIAHQGEYVSWTTRSIVKNVEPRYLNCPEEWERMPAKNLLYGEDYCGESVVVCEGPVDVWKIGPGAVCTFGTAFTKVQTARLTKFSRIAVCFDSTDEGQRRGRELMDQIGYSTPNVVNVRLETGKDAGDADEDELKELRRRFLL